MILGGSIKQDNSTFAHNMLRELSEETMNIYGDIEPEDFMEEAFTFKKK